MGLSSSQGRLLMLTSRLSDIELQQMIISQRQNQLAWKEAEAAKEYSEAMNNYKLVMKVPDEEGERQNKDLTYSTLTQMGYLVTDKTGNIYLEQKEVTVADKKAQLNAQLANTPENETELREQLAQQLAELEGKSDDEVLGNEWVDPEIEGLVIDQVNGTVTINGGTPIPIKNGNDFLKNTSQLQSLLMNNVLAIKNTTDSTASLMSASELLESNTDFEYVLDTSDDAAAESKHNYEMSLLSAKENMLEMDLAQLETQHEAVMKEYESVKELISNNVDRTFKLFSNG